MDRKRERLADEEDHRTSPLGFRCINWLPPFFSPTVCRLSHPEWETKIFSRPSRRLRIPSRGAPSAVIAGLPWASSFSPALNHDDRCSQGCSDELFIILFQWLVIFLSSSGAPNMEVVFPSKEAAAAALHDTAGSGNVDPACSIADGESDAAAGVDIDALVAAAIDKLHADLAALAKDPTRKAKSKDPGWKYGFWPVLGKKELVQCIFFVRKKCMQGSNDSSNTWQGGYSDAEKCPGAGAKIRKELCDYLKSNARTPFVVIQQPADEEGGQSGPEVVLENVPSSRTKAKQAAAVTKRIHQASIASFMVSGSVKPQTQKFSKSVSSMLCKTPEEVVQDRHTMNKTQPTLEHCTKKTKEAKEIVDDHVADFYYENGIPFNAIKSRSWEIMLESIGQYGPGYHSPSYHEMRVPLLEKAVKKTQTLREKHEDTFFSLQIHIKKRNRLEHQRLNKLVEWVDANCEPVQQGGGAVAANDITWANVDEAIGASQGLRGRNLPRAAAVAPNYYGRNRKTPRVLPTNAQDIDMEEAKPIADDLMQKDEEAGPQHEANRSASVSGGSVDLLLQEPGFQLDDALFDG
ncbi:hypothetical protein PR202_ga24482 [Eleusine coracana subsp. coracana]|uniref:Uncharacterized protein n=1 Tax=Eleusine coracana subsp. coracana TaxID=191504 RepID=A0AAV5D8Y5_ELECO|nr:hypothetical protein PR202_ga24482 [Eleusine coracana subsp. coracana]